MEVFVCVLVEFGYCIGEIVELDVVDYLILVVVECEGNWLFFVEEVGEFDCVVFVVDEGEFGVDVIVVLVGDFDCLYFGR